jgi:gas vesicle protein
MDYEYEKEDANASTKLTYLLIGGGIGAILALLFAPKSGQELREDIAVATKKGIEKGKETAVHLQDAAGDYYEVTRERANEIYHTAQERAGEFSEKAKMTAEELGEKAKAAAAQTANPISAAFEAGKEAYKEEKRKNEAKAIAEGRPSYPVKEGAGDEVLEVPEGEGKNETDK